MTQFVPNHKESIADSVSKKVWYASHTIKSVGAAGAWITNGVDAIGTATRFMIVYLCAASGVFLAETLIVWTALSGLDFALGNQAVTGIVFFSVCPLAFAAWHIRVHEEHDERLKRLFGRLGWFGLLFIVFGISGMIATEFIRGGLDNMLDGAGGSGFTGTGVAGGGAQSPWEAILMLLDGVPTLFFGVGLFFSLIIAMNVASFFIGKAKRRYNYIKDVKNLSAELEELRETEALSQDVIACQPIIAKLLRDVPADPVGSFTKDVGSYVSGEITHFATLTGLAYRAPTDVSLEELLSRPGDAEVIQMLRSKFDNYDAAIEHLGELEDGARSTELRKILDGNSVRSLP